MTKKILLLITVLHLGYQADCQVLYSNSFGNLTLQTYTTAGSSTKFSGVPGSMAQISDGRKNNIGSAANPNRPFNEPGLKTAPWAVVYNQADNDTFLVSTSWLDTTGVQVDRWVVTPIITNINANTVLTWLAKSPDPNYRDGYEVYGTANTGVLTPQNFTMGDRLFFVPDANTNGGGENSSWTRRSVSLGSFTGQALRFAFRNNSTDMYQLWIDDIEVLNLAKTKDGALAPVIQKKYILVSTPDTIRFFITNKGAANIYTVNASYQVGNATVNTEDLLINGGLAYGQTAHIKFALPQSISQAGYYKAKCWINTVNGSADQDLANDTTSYAITVQSASPAKTVLLEQFVSANNGECPDAQERALALQSPSVIVVNIHDLDSLKEINSATLISDYRKNIPGGMIDRVFFSDLGSFAVDRPAYAGRIAARLKAVTPASVSITNKSYNSSTRTLSFTVKADFFADVKGDYRINAYLTENYVNGPVSDTTVNGYNQLNNYFGVPWSPYYQQGYYSAAAGTHVLNYWQFQHHNVLVHAFDGAYGSSGIIPPNAITQGQSYQQTYTLSIPTATNGIRKFNADNLYIVAFVAEYSADKDGRNVLNAAREKMTPNPEVVSLKEVASSTRFSIYPNPSEGIFHLNSDPSGMTFDIKVFDLPGNCVMTTTIGNAGHMENIDLSGLQDGFYIMRITSGKEEYSETLLIRH